PPLFRKSDRMNGRPCSSRWRALESWWTSMANESRALIPQVLICRPENNGTSQNASRSGRKPATLGCKTMTPATSCGSKKLACDHCRLAKANDRYFGIYDL